MNGIADTGLLVAFLNRRDRFHRWAVDLAGTFTVPLITCEAVLAETAFHIRSTQVTLALIETGFVRLDFAIADHRERLSVLSERYADRAPDLADLCLICLSERHSRHPVITVDRDFRIYRRHQRERIPLVMPGEIAE